MTKYREILRLTGLGFSQRDIMASYGVAQKTVVKVQKRAKALSISWSLDESLTDIELEKLMFQQEDKPSSKRRMPDYDYIRKELLRNGVSKKLLWTEYMDHPYLYLTIHQTETGFCLLPCEAFWHYQRNTWPVYQIVLTLNPLLSLLFQLLPFD